MSQNGFNGYESNTSMSGMSKGPTDRQIETFLPGGKRRITPLYIQPSLPFNATSSITFSSSKESKTKIMIETTSSTPVATPTPSYGPTTPIKSQSQPAANTPPIVVTTAATATISSLTPAIASSIPTAATQSIPTIRRELLIPRTSQTTLEPAKIDKATVFRIRGSDNRESILEAENDTNSVKLNELRLMDDANNKVWDTLLSSKINSVIATEVFAAASCLDNSLHFFELSTGRRLIPPMMLDSPVAQIAAEKAHILVITSNANMWLWDLNNNKVLVKGEPVSSILSPPSNSTTKQGKGGTNQSGNRVQGKGGAGGGGGGGGGGDKAASSSKQQNEDTHANNQSIGGKNLQDTRGDIEILSCSLTEHYQPLLLLSTGKAFVYDYNLHCWLLISDSNDSITRWSSCKPSVTAMKRFLNQMRIDSSDEMRSMRKNLPLASLQSQHSFDTKRFANLINKNGSESLQVKATRSYLDQQLASALAIKSAHEYHYWLIQSVQHYVDTGAELRLRDLCSRLISSAFGATSDSVGGNEDNSGRSPQARAAEGGGNSSSSRNNQHDPNHHIDDITETETNDHILGLSKLNLLREVLSILSKDLRYQRLYSEYKQLLDYER